MHSYVANLALIKIRQKRLDLMKNRVSFSILRNRKCVRYLLEVTLSARAQFTIPAYFGKIRQSHTELVFLFLLLLFFCLSLILSLLVLFFTLHFAKHKEKTYKMYANLQVFELFLFSVLRLT